MEYNLKGVQGFAGPFDDKINSVATAADAIQAKQGQLNAQILDAANILNGLAMEQQGRDNQLALEREQIKKNVGTAFGADMNQKDNILAYLAAEQGQAIRASNERMKEATRLADASVFDNPLEYMLARPFAYRDVQAATAEKQRAEVLGNQIQAINSGAAETLKTQLSLQEQFNTEDASRKLAIQEASAKKGMAELEQKQDQNQLTTLKAVQEIAVNQFQVVLAKWRAQKENEELELRKQNARLANKKLKAEAEADETALRWYNLAAPTLGRQQLPNVAALVAAKQYDPETTTALIRRGGSNVTGEPIAATPGRSFLVLDKLQGSLPPSAVRTNEFKQLATAQAIQSLKKDPNAKVTADTVTAQMDIEILGGTTEVNGKKVQVPGIARQMLADVERAGPGNTANLYGPQSLQTVLSVAPQLKDLKGFEYIQNAALAGQGTVKAQEAFNQIWISDLDPAAGASALSNFFAATALTNRATEMYNRTALPDQFGYRTKIKDPITGALVDIDLVNEPKKLEHMLFSAKQKKFQQSKNLLATPQFKPAPESNNPLVKGMGMSYGELNK